MRLSEFVRQHPGCTVGRPEILPHFLTSALSLGGMLLMAGLAWQAFGAPRGEPTVVAGLGMGLGAGAVALGRLRRLARALELWIRGTSSYAIGERELVLVNAVGSALVIEIGRIEALELRGDEPRLVTDGEHQGLVYAALFDLFDVDRPGPCAARFFDQLAPRLRTLCPNATIERSPLSQ